MHREKNGSEQTGKAFVQTAAILRSLRVRDIRIFAGSQGLFLPRIKMMTKQSASPATPGNPLWFKDAVIYETHVKTFADSDGGGVGEGRGEQEPAG
jgi:hypothetical protein